ncbi:MAG: hypothetical protein ACI8RD_002513 [Bacillariaceae sp.]|jgi:hypothetical protein
MLFFLLNNITVSVCFGIGEEQAFYVEKNPSLLIAWIKHNIQFFYLNYLLLSAVFFVLTLFVTPFHQSSGSDVRQSLDNMDYMLS